MFTNILFHSHVNLNVGLQCCRGTEMLATDMADSTLFAMHFCLVFVVLVGVEELFTTNFTLHSFFTNMPTIGVHGQSNSACTTFTTDSANHHVLFVMTLHVGL